MILLSIAAEKTGDFVMVKEMDIGKFPSNWQQRYFLQEEVYYERQYKTT